MSFCRKLLIDWIPPSIFILKTFELVPTKAKFSLIDLKHNIVSLSSNYFITLILFLMFSNKIMELSFNIIYKSSRLSFILSISKILLFKLNFRKILYKSYKFETSLFYEL